MLSLHKLEIFNTVIEEGSFSKAAERLLLTQSAVSQHIQGLEAKLGTVLFNRERRGVTLTPAGETLRDYTRCILRLLAEAESAITNVEHLSSGHIRIGATPGAGMYLLPEWLRAFQARLPKLAVSITTDVTDQIAKELIGGGLDIGLIEGELDDEPRLAGLNLDEIDQLLIVGRDHALFGQSSVPVTALDGLAFIARPRKSHSRQWFDRTLRRAGIVPRVVAELDTPEAIKQAVIAGVGVALLPAYAVRYEVRAGLVSAIPITGVALRRALRLVWRADEPFSAVTRAFLTYLSEPYPQLLSLQMGGAQVLAEARARRFGQGAR